MNRDPREPIDLDGFQRVPDAEALGWGGDRPELAELVREVKPLTIIEVGAWLGMSTIALAKAAPNATIYSVDTWLGSEEMWPPDNRSWEEGWSLHLCHGYPRLYDRWLTNLIRFGVVERVRPVPMTSRQAARWLTKVGIKGDLIYIDGSHVFEDVSADVFDYASLLTPRGVLCGDDAHMPDVWRAVTAQYPTATTFGDGRFWRA